MRARAQTFLDRDVATLWPGAVEDGGFRWSLLCDGTSPSTSGPERLDTQYWRANTDPSDRYVQSLPGTDQYRLQPGAPGSAISWWRATGPTTASTRDVWKAPPGPGGWRPRRSSNNYEGAQGMGGA